MAEEEKTNNLAKDFAEGAYKVTHKQPQVVSINGKTRKIKQLRRFARYWIERLNREAWWCEQQAKKPISLKQSHKIARKLSILHAKTAAIHLLGLKALIPFAYAIKWRMLMLRYDDEIAQINTAAYAGDEQINFSSANWEITKLQLARSTNLIGAGLTELQKRMESARKQAEEDLRKKAESK